MSVDIKKVSVPKGIVDYIIGTNDGSAVAITATFASTKPELPYLYEHRSINITWSEIKCSCDAPNNEICSHVNIVLLASLDSALIRRFLESDKDTANLEVPLFGISERMFVVSTKLHKKRYPAGVFAEVFIKASDVEDTEMFEGGYTSAGNSFHKLGVIGPNDGREAIRGMIASWVKSQDAIIENLHGLDGLECDSYYHGALAEANGYISSDPRERTCIYITGECISCFTASRSIDSDIPEV